MRKVPVQQAVGSVLCHDITRIIPGKVQEAAFKKGHVVREEDIEELLKLGKDHVYVWEPQPGMLHEDDAALRIAAAAAKAGIEWDDPSEGKVELKAVHPGVLRVDVEALRQVNSVEQVTLVTRRNHEPVLHRGEQIAAARVIPLFIEEEKVAAAEKVMAQAGGILAVTPFRLKRVGVVITGNEVYYGRIQDGFGPVLREKFAALGLRDRWRGVCPRRPVGYRRQNPLLCSKRRGDDRRHRRHVGGPGRPDSRCDQSSGCRDRLLRHSHAAGQHVLGGLSGRPSGDGASRLCHV